jgi:hypothetical protein
MRYWGLLALKLSAAAAVLAGVWRGMTLLFSPPRLTGTQFLNYVLPWTLAAGLVFLVACGLIYVCLLDQRYRCRVCARRLRMPIVKGSWGQMLQLGRPRIEYICPFGHGTLRVSELQISGLEPSDWQPNGDMWQELLALDERER